MPGALIVLGLLVLAVVLIGGWLGWVGVSLLAAGMRAAVGAERPIVRKLAAVAALVLVACGLVVLEAVRIADRLAWR